MKLILIIPILFICASFPTTTNAWTNPITTEIMSTIIDFLPSFKGTIPDFFPDIMGVSEIYGTITTYTNYSCPLKWIVRTRGNYIYYYMEIQQRINDTRDRVLANYTYWSENFLEVGNSIDTGLVELNEILTQNMCSSSFVTEYLNVLKNNLTVKIGYVNSLHEFYQSVANTIPRDLAYAFPNELIKALTRQSIMSFGDLGRAVRYAELLHFYEDRRIYYDALDTIEWAMYGFNYGIFYSTRKSIEEILKRAKLNAIRNKCVF